MKISSVSKKVLAAALSAAMVVAFSPAAALAANNTGNIVETPVAAAGHNMDNGTVTKAPTCSTNGYMTFKCTDGDDYSYVSIIPATGVHDWKVDTTNVADTDKDGVVWAVSGSTPTGATAYFACESGKEKFNKAATVTHEVTKAATFAATGEDTYTAIATLGDAQAKSTFVKPIAKRTLGAAAFVVDTDYAAAKLNITDGASKAFTIAGKVAVEETAATCTSKKTVKPTVTFAMVDGLSAAAVKNVLTGTTGWTVTASEDDATLTVAKNAADQVGDFDLNNHKVVVSKVQYQGADVNTANAPTDLSTNVADWTVTAACAGSGTGHTQESYNAVNPTSITKETKGDQVTYTLAYGNGHTTQVKSAHAKHEYTTAPTVEWNYVAGTATLTYKCDVCGDSNKVVIPVGTTATANGSQVTSVTNKAASCVAEGSKTWTVKVAKADLVAAGITAATADFTATSVETLAKLPAAPAHTYTATVTFNGSHTVAYVKIACSGTEYTETKTVTSVTAKVTPTTVEGSTKTTGSTEYSVNFASDLPASITIGGTGVTKNADGTYTIKATVADASVTASAVAYAGSVNAAGLPTDAENLANWTVTDSAKSYTPTKVEANAAASKAGKCGTSPVNPVAAYTLTYANGKTVIATVTGTAPASHVGELDHFELTDSGTKVKAVEKCSVCGELINGTPVAFTNGIAEVVLSDGKTKYQVGQYTVNAYTYKAPVFTWNGTSVTAKFVSTDGKMEINVPVGGIDVVLIDPETGTYKATIKAAYVPAGYTGELSETKAVNLHEGHAMVETDRVKASTSKAGYIKYYCNVDGKDYIVAIAKDNMKLAASSKTFKASVVKKKAQSVTIKVQNAKGKVSFKASTAAKKAGVTVSSKGKVTVKKGTAKGTYKVTVTSAATDEYAKATKTFSVRVK